MQNALKISKIIWNYFTPSTATFPPRKSLAGEAPTIDFWLFLYMLFPCRTLRNMIPNYDNCNCALFFVQMGRGNNHQLTNPKLLRRRYRLYFWNDMWGTYFFECKVPSGTFCLNWVYRMVPNPRLIMIRSWLDSSGFRKSHHTILLRSHESKIVDFSHSWPVDLSQSRHGGRGGVEQRWDDLLCFFFAIVLFKHRQFTKITKIPATKLG